MNPELSNRIELAYIREDQCQVVRRLKTAMGYEAYQELLNRLVREDLDKAINMLEVSEAEKLANPQEQREV